MSDKNSAYSFLGLLRRGGKVIIGTESIEHALKPGFGLILAKADSSTVARLKTKGVNAGCLIFEGADKSKLGEALGFGLISAALIKDKKAAKSFEAKWGEKENCNEEK